VSATIKAGGDTWRAEVENEEGDATIVFFCETTDQRPYRVVRAGRPMSDGDLAALSEGDLRGLFDRSRSMGAPIEYPTYGS
jgi:hypothetical protein